jgi:hypothetical protein
LLCVVVCCCCCCCCCVCVLLCINICCCVLCVVYTRTSSLIIGTHPVVLVAVVHGGADKSGALEAKKQLYNTSKKRIEHRQEDKCGHIVALFGETSVELMKGATATKTCLSTTASLLRHHMDAWSACDACHTMTRRATSGT